MSRPMVRGCHGQCLDEGVPGLKRNKTLPSRVPPMPREFLSRATTKTAQQMPPKTSHWTRSTIAKAAGISASSGSDALGSMPMSSRTS